MFQINEEPEPPNEGGCCRDIMIPPNEGACLTYVLAQVSARVGRVNASARLFSFV